jgi:hypothetical protein
MTTTDYFVLLALLAGVLAWFWWGYRLFFKQGSNE